MNVIRATGERGGGGSRVLGYAVMGILGVCILFGLWHVCRPTWTPDRIARSKRIGDEILRAIAAFYEDHGRCPRELEELVPDYIERIEPPPAGLGRWVYKVRDGGNGCNLAFGVGRACYPRYFIMWPDMSDWQLDS